MKRLKPRSTATPPRRETAEQSWWPLPDIEPDVFGVSRRRRGDSAPRLGKDRLRALSLDSFAANLAAPEVAAVMTVDWARLDREAGLLYIESSILRKLLRGVSVENLHGALGVSRRNAAVAYDSLLNKLKAKASGPDAERYFTRSLPAGLAHRERLPSGRLCWTVNVEQCIAVAARVQTSGLANRRIASKLYSPLNQTDRAKTIKSGEFCPGKVGAQNMTTMNESRELIVRAEKLRERLAVKLDAAHTAVADAERALAKKRAAIKADRVQSMLEERELSVELSRELSSLEQQVDAAREQVEIAAAACRAQVEKIAELKSALEGRRNEMLKSALSGPRAEFFAALEPAIKAAAKLEAVIVEGGGTDMNTIFPTSRPDDPLADIFDRGRLMRVFSSLLSMRSRPGWEGDESIPYHRRKRFAA